MRYKAIKINETAWGVKVGRSRGTSFSFVTSSRTPYEKVAIQQAAFWNAQDLIKQATKLAKSVTLKDQMTLAQEANEICRDYEERALEEDPEFNPMDSRAYLC